MGVLLSKDTRRISFDNNFQINSALLIDKSIEDKNTLAINNLENELSSELNFEENSFYKVIRDEEYKYWSDRIESLKNEHQTITKIIETEYEKTIENSNKLYEHSKITDDQRKKIKPCYNWRAKIMQCYENNPHQSLECSPMVQAFNQYVESCRVDE